MNIRKNVFTIRVTDHWQKLPRDVVDGVSILGDTLSVHGLGQLTVGDPA